MSNKARTAPARHAAVTGAAGYLGRALCRRLADDERWGRVLALDQQAPPAIPGVDSLQMDINDGELAGALEGVDTAFHLAFALGSSHTDAEARHANLDGTTAVCEAVAAAGVGTLVVSSSVSAYGARADNPARLIEDDPLLAAPGLRYAAHKAEVERGLDGFEARHPGVRVVRLRIGVIVGPPPRPGDATKILTLPVLPLPRGYCVQFVHVDDVNEALLAAAENQQARGPYNIAAEPPLDSATIARISGQRHFPVPSAVFGLLSRAAHGLQLNDPDRVDFLRFPILVDCGRARRELGWIPHHQGEVCLRALMPHEPSRRTT